jgi:hypothetical protein
VLALRARTSINIRITTFKETGHPPVPLNRCEQKRVKQESKRGIDGDTTSPLISRYTDSSDINTRFQVL